MTKINVTLDDLRALLDSARRAGNVDGWIEVALQWMAAADLRIDDLETILMHYRTKRRWDGLDGRTWDATKHALAEELIKQAEKKEEGGG